ncbi:MAG: exo-alpha-sialidase [Planctomycetes bacterium]|nr:exo-alpha-sialidase [Planctomycetota bacterium]
MRLLRMHASLAALIVLVGSGGLNAEEPYATDAAGFIPYWVVLEPVTVSAAEGKGKGLDKDYIGEAGAKPSPGEKLKCAGQEVAWKLQTVEDGTPSIDGEATDGARLYIVTYLVAYLVLEKDMDLSVLWGTDDSGAVFVNGKEAGRFAGGRGCVPDSGLTEKISFKKGVNVVMLKVLNESGNWAGCARIVDADNAPVAGLRLAATPEGKAPEGAGWPVVKTGQKPVKLPAPPRKPAENTAANAAGGWKNVRGNLGGGSAGLVLMSAVPEKDEVLAYLNQNGIWSSASGGDSWIKLGAGDDEPISNLPHHILFDPKDAHRFWSSGAYGSGIWGPGVFMTKDGGKTFQRQGYAGHTAGIGVDFADPERKTQLVGTHEGARRLYLSKDGGQKWFNIGKRLPQGSGFCHSVIVADAATLLVGCWKGWNPHLSDGIYRSEDAGETWTKVSDFGPSANPLLLKNGGYIWSCSNFLIQSSDKGKTWKKMDGPAESSPIELPEDKLAALAKDQIYVTADAGKTWEKTCEPLPDKCAGIVYNSVRKTFFTWRADAVYRWEGK